LIFLGELLSYLDRGEADEVVMQSGQPARLRSGSSDRALGDKPLTRDAILAALHGSSVGAVIPKDDTAGAIEVVEIRGRAYMMNVAKFLDLIEVRIARMPGDERPDPPVGGANPTRREITRQTAREVDRSTRREVERQTARGVSRQTARDVSPPMPVDLGESPPRPDDEDALGPPTHIPPIPRERAPAAARATAELAPHPLADVTPPVGPRGKREPTAARPEPGPDEGPAARARIVVADDAELPQELVDVLVAARAEGASDVHVQQGEPIRVRIVGQLATRDMRATPGLLERSASALLNERLLEQFETRGHVDFSAQHPKAGRLRLNLCRQRGGLKLCARLVADRPPTAAALGFPPQMERFALLHQGLCVIAGPSGHGKTTTMAALIDGLNGSKPEHIITVEDPVEIIHPVKRAIVTQREVGTHTETFGSALKAALREDPDVIAIGELRDRETVEMALSAAETGHLVLATMNTPSGAKTIARLIELFPPEDQAQVRATLCGALKLIVSQRLIPRTDGTRMVAAFEVITGGPPLWGLIRDNKLHQLPSLLQRGKAYGMRRIEESLRELVLQKAITHEEALRYAEDPRALAGNDATVGASWNPNAGGA
jgi:twitching motility protein PilT